MSLTPAATLILPFTWFPSALRVPPADGGFCQDDRLWSGLQGPDCVKGDTGGKLYSPTPMAGTPGSGRQRNGQQSTLVIPHVFRVRHLLEKRIKSSQ